MLKYLVNTPSGRPDSDELPLVVILHGRGADARDLADLAPMLDNGRCRFVFPNAPHAFEAYPGMTFGWTWFHGWPPSRESIAETRQLLLDFLDEIVKVCPTPADQIILGGFSQGALMSLDCGFRTTTPLAGIVVMSGAIFEADLPDLRARAGQRILICHGTADDVIPVIAARRTRRVLEELGIDPEYHEFPIGHQVSEEEIAIVSEFIRRCLG
jgi:phospholipase/carboxylesterase